MSKKEELEKIMQETINKMTLKELNELKVKNNFMCENCGQKFDSFGDFKFDLKPKDRKDYPNELRYSDIGIVNMGFECPSCKCFNPKIGIVSSKEFIKAYKLNLKK